MSNIWPTPKYAAVDKFLSLVSLLVELNIISGDTEFEIIWDCDNAEFIRKRVESQAARGALENI